MKIAVYDKDLPAAAKTSFSIQNLLKIDITYCGDIDDRELSRSNVVIADPSPEPVKAWVKQFRELHGDTPLVLYSDAADLLGGSLGDGCFAITKEGSIRELIDVVKGILLQKPKVQIMQSAKKEN